jgi:hypothetical protein
MRQRFLTKKVTLETATTEELFTEFMKRIVAEQPAICYFVDSLNTDHNKYEIHKARTKPIVISQSIN